MDYFTVKDNQLVSANPDIGSKVITTDPVLAVQKPCRRTVKVKGSDKYLPFPYIVFICNHTSFDRIRQPCLRAALCLESPTSKSTIYAIPLGNFYLFTIVAVNKDVRICTSAFNEYFTCATPDNLIEYFWNSGFDVEWDTCANKIMRDGYEGWSRIPMEDVLNSEHWTEISEIFLKMASEAPLGPQINKLQDLIQVSLFN